MPLHTLKLNLSLSSLFVLVICFITSPLLLASESEGSVVLPSITVFGIKKSDDTFVQVSEVEWGEFDDKSVTKENDGSYTARSTTNAYDLKSLIVSLGSPIVNIDISYAKRSSSMTADGRLIFNNLVEALRHLDDGTRLEITPTRDNSNTKDIMQRRLDELLRLISDRHDIAVVVKPSLSNQAYQPSSSGRSDLWRIKLRQIRAL